LPATLVGSGGWSYGLAQSTSTKDCRRRHGNRSIDSRPSASATRARPCVVQAASQPPNDVHGELPVLNGWLIDVRKHSCFAQKDHASFTERQRETLVPARSRSPRPGRPDSIDGRVAEAQQRDGRQRGFEGRTSKCRHTINPFGLDATADDEVIAERIGGTLKDDLV
jgi:hypothetical protein